MLLKYPCPPPRFQISILHKYDYHRYRADGRLGVTSLFQFYISTIIMNNTDFDLFAAYISILHKYDYHQSEGDSAAFDEFHFNST